MIEVLIDRGLLPDPLLRAGIRRVVGARLREQRAGGADGQVERLRALLHLLRGSPIALSTEAANAQHYEVPAAFFERVLGPRVKYSAAWWPAGVDSLADAELRMLELTAERALLGDGQRILDLGCGWGSLTLYLAAAFPGSRIVGVSNSASQRAYITSKARARGLNNIRVITSDINRFAPDQGFDRIVSVEMLEHVRNYPALFARIARWLDDGGRFFAHVFAHRSFAYFFEARGASDWMARHFFTGGMMPSVDLFDYFEDDLVIEDRWQIDGRHYQRTAECWLRNLDRDGAAIASILATVHGERAALRWRARWRVFFLACAEMFGYRDGQEWMIAHYRFKKRGS